MSTPNAAWFAGDPELAAIVEPKQQPKPYWVYDPTQLRAALADIGASHVSNEFVEALLDDARTFDDKRDPPERAQRFDPQTGFEE